MRGQQKVTFSLPLRQKQELRRVCEAKGVSVSEGVFLMLEHVGLAHLREMAPRLRTREEGEKAHAGVQ